MRGEMTYVGIPILIDNKIDDHSHFDEGPQISIPTADCDQS